jgi:integrase
MSAAGYVEEKLAPGLIERRLASGEIVYRSKVYADGREFFRTFESVNRTEAKRLHTAHANEVKNEGLRPAPSLTLGELRDLAFAHFETLIATGSSNGKRLRVGRLALRNYRSAWDKRITPYQHRRKSIDEVKLGDLDRKLAREWLAWLASTGVAPSTQNGTLSAIRTVLRWARDNDMMAVDPFAAVPTEERPAQRPREQWDARVLTVEEVRRVSIAAHSPDYLKATPHCLFSNIIDLYAYSGVRLSEGMGLVWEDVDLVSKVLTIRQQRAHHKAAEPAARAQTKSERSVRSFKMRPAVYEALLDQLGYEQAKGLGRPSDFVFTTNIGTPVTIEHVKSAVRRATRMAGLGEHGPQVLRRSFATQVAHAHIPSIEAEAMLGHSAATFESNYAKPLRDAEQMRANDDALAALDFGSVSA